MGGVGSRSDFCKARFAPSTVLIRRQGKARLIQRQGNEQGLHGLRGRVMHRKIMLSILFAVTVHSAAPARAGVLTYMGDDENANRVAMGSWVLAGVGSWLMADIDTFAFGLAAQAGFLIGMVIYPENGSMPVTFDPIQDQDLEAALQLGLSREQIAALNLNYPRINAILNQITSEKPAGLSSEDRARFAHVRWKELSVILPQEAREAAEILARQALNAR